MRIKFLFLFSICLLGIIYSVFTHDNSNGPHEKELLEFVNSSDINNIKKILESQEILSRKAYDQAIIISANKGNYQIYKLLEPRVSRKAHREAYMILNQKNKIDFDQDEIVN